MVKIQPIVNYGGIPQGPVWWWGQKSIMGIYEAFVNLFTPEEPF